MQNNIFSELKSGYDFLTKSEKKIADLLLNDPQKFITYSTGELSKEADVSQGSINNFSKKFSSGGYSALKLKVAACISSKKEQPFSLLDKSTSVKDALEIKINENIATFYNTFEINDEKTLNSVVNSILNAKRIEVCGAVHSGITAKDLCYQLIQLGIPATFVEDTLMGAASASMLNEDCLVIAISSSGRTKEILDVVELAKNNNVPVISITSNKFSPLAKISDEVLLTASSGVSISDRNNEIRLAQLLIIDALCSYIRSTIDTDGKEFYYKMQKILNSHSVDD